MIEKNGYFWYTIQIYYAYFSLNKTMRKRIHTAVMRFKSKKNILLIAGVFLVLIVGIGAIWLSQPRAKFLRTDTNPDACDVEPQSVNDPVECPPRNGTNGTYKYYSEMGCCLNGEERDNTQCGAPVRIQARFYHRTCGTDTSPGPLYVGCKAVFDATVKSANGQSAIPESDPQWTCTGPANIETGRCYLPSGMVTAPGTISCTVCVNNGTVCDTATVVAVANGNSNSGGVECGTPPAPATLTAQCTGSGPSVRLTWNNQAGACASGLLRSVNGGETTWVEPGPAMGETTFTDVNVSRGNSYSYRFKNHPSVSSSTITVNISSSGACTIGGTNSNQNGGTSNSNTNAGGNGNNNGGNNGNGNGSGGNNNTNGGTGGNSNVNASGNTNTNDGTGGNNNLNGGTGGNGNTNGGTGGNSNTNGGTGGNQNENSTTHKACQQRRCVELPGPGGNFCTGDEDCALDLENLFILTNPFNALRVNTAIENGKVRLTLPETNSNVTWSLRGTSGGTLDQYAGSEVIYTPGGINGDEVISLSDGTSRAYVAIQVRYINAIVSLDVTVLNTIGTDPDLDFELNLSLGADIGDRIQFKAIGQYRDPETDLLSFKDVTTLVTWSSTNPPVGDIVTGGLFSAVTTGTTSIYATAEPVSSNVIIIHVNPTFPSVNPSGYEPHFNPNPMARGYTTRFWVFIQTDTGPDDLEIVSADLSQFNIAPVCEEAGNSNSTGGDCNSDWRMTGAEFEGNGRWYYIEFRVPFTVADGTYPVRIQATSVSGQIDRHLTVDLRVVSEVTRGDVSGDGLVTIQDAIYSLQVAVGKLKETSSKINVLGDCNGDGHIGLPEAICVLHSLTL